MKNLFLYLLLLIAIPATAQQHHHPSHHEGPHHHPHAPAPAPVPQGMNPKDFDLVVNIISKESFDKNRLMVAERVVMENDMTTRQIADICDLFTFEASKLEFAKFAYRFCVDKNMYFLLNEVFTFKASREELYEYIHRF